MKLRFSIEKQIELQPEIVEEKVNTYLKNNFYRVVQQGQGYVLFINDEYSERKPSRSDLYKRIGEGKFEIQLQNDVTMIKLIYLTRMNYPIFLIMAFSAFGIYINSFAPMLMSFAFILPILHRIYYLRENVFEEVLK